MGIKDRILAVSKVKPVPFSHSTWGDVYCRKVNAIEMTKLMEVKDKDTEFGILFTSISLCDEDGTPVFKNDEVGKLNIDDVLEFVAFASSINFPTAKKA